MFCDCKKETQDLHMDGIAYIYEILYWNPFLILSDTAAYQTTTI